MPIRALPLLPCAAVPEAAPAFHREPAAPAASVRASDVPRSPSVSACAVVDPGADLKNAAAAATTFVGEREATSEMPDRSAKRVPAHPETYCCTVAANRRHAQVPDIADGFEERVEAADGNRC